ncbi:MAG: radical SAM protein [Candidatus Gastranaerophilales bacterium]|nr:radical SAM protein [Candidatus Gastranaerophilales bacterium]
MDLKELLISADNRVKDFHEMQELGIHCNTGEFIPAGVHYPPITRYPDIEYDEMFKGYTMPSDEYLDVYVHFPFCSKQCIFCHYPSMYKNDDAEKDRYIDALEKNFDIYMRKLGIDKIKLRVALIGGGTPTDLTTKQLERFLKIFTDRCDMSKVRQFNYDVSPHTLIGDIGHERLKIMRDYGVDRLTIGIQSMDDKVLKIMNRPHNVKEALESVKNTMDMGFQTNIEFIYGHPGQTVESWYEELKQVVKIDVHEYQFYRLKVEAYGDQQGIIKKWEEMHPDGYPTPDDTIRMKQMVFDYLKEFGIEENLRRVFTRKKSYISLYAFNQCCQQLDQIGIGLTAFSSLRDRFVLNMQSFDDYYARIEKGMLPFNRGYVRNSDAQQRWAIILPLKNYFIRKNRYKQVAGIDIEQTKFYPLIQQLKNYDLLTEDDKIIRLTDKGIIFSDEIVGLFYDTKFIPKERKYFNEGIFNPYKLNG